MGRDGKMDLRNALYEMFKVIIITFKKKYCT